MKELLKEVDRLRARDKAISEEKLTDNILKFTKGQGEGDLSNLARLKKGMGDKDKAILEMNLLNRIFEKSLIENTTLDLSVFDSKAFLDELSKIKGAFESKEAGQFLDIIQGFNKLFNQDAEIARSFKNSLTQKEGANIATSLQGKAQMAVIKVLWENIVRLMGKIPFLHAWNEKVQGAALRYHISHALKRAVSVEDFKNNFTQGLKKGQFNNKTKDLIKEFTQNLDECIKETEALAKMSDEELVKQGVKEENEPLKDFIFKDKKDKEHILTKEVQEQWLKTFNLQDINQIYIPKQPQEVKEALGNKEIKLQIGSLKKLVSQGREQYIPQIKEVLENPQAIIKDEAGDFLLIKHLKDDDYFVNVSFDNGEYLVNISNGIKETNNLKNKLKAGAEVLYQSPNANSILQTLLQASRYSTNKIDKIIIPQNQTQSQTIQVIQNLSIEEAKDELAKMSPTFGAHLNEAEKFKLACLKMKLDDIQPEFWRYLFDKDDAIKTLFEAKYRVSEELIPKEIKDLRADIEKAFSIQPIKDYGTNYAEFYRDGKGAIHKLLTEKRGQVAGTFYREDLEELSGVGEIDLVWGKITNAEKKEGFGLAHILDKHPEMTSDILTDVIENGKLIQQNEARFRIEKNKYVVGLSGEFKGEKRNFILTAFERNKDLDTISPKPKITDKSDNSLSNLDKDIIPKIQNKFKQKNLDERIKDAEALAKMSDEELITREMKAVLDNWDLSPQGLHNKQQRLVIERLSENESDIIRSEFNFKEKYPLLREIRAFEFNHTLKKHGVGNETNPANIPITKDDIYQNYPKVIKNFDLREITDHSIIYAKQINGHFIVIEETLSGQDKVIFKTAWKTKGKLNKDVLLRGIRSQAEPNSSAFGRKSSSKDEMRSNLLAPEALTTDNLPQTGLKKNKTPIEPKNPAALAKMSDEEVIKKEMKETYGVVYNGENATLIYKDLQNIENAILLEKGDKHKGATHIRLKHTLDNNQQGFVTPNEVQNIGQNVRKYLKEYNEPFIDKDSARLYEWKDEKGVKFRLVARDINKASGADTRPTSASEEIITFYSNRNLKEGENFEFKNPALKEFNPKAQNTPIEPKNPAALAKMSDEELSQSEKEFIRTFTDKNKPLMLADREQLTDNVLKEVIKRDSKIYIADVSENLAKELGLKNSKITMRGSAIAHALNRHGENSNLVQQSGFLKINNEDIINHSNIVNNADKQGISLDKNGQKVLISGKQVNGYFVVVESISTKGNELKFKTMYKENGDLQKSKAFDKVKRLLSSKNEPSILQTQRQGTDLDSFHLSTSKDIISQNAKKTQTQKNKILKTLCPNKKTQKISKF